MNFTTDLPKRNPLVSYIVASAVICEKFLNGPGDQASINQSVGGGQPTKNPIYRMHAVILKLKPNQTPGEVPVNPFNSEKGEKRPLYVCCHIRRCEESEVDMTQQNATLRKAVSKACLQAQDL